ncbi:hypothetical protein I552_3744 [Mycobacterium xenopi 3993]|nr:hypothetical protein I552_3744 [Mycobacterium xenopi 3993]
MTQLLATLDARLELAAGQVWTQAHSLAFDYSVWEIFGRYCTAGAWWWSQTRWCAHPRICTRCWWPSRSAC